MLAKENQAAGGKHVPHSLDCTRGVFDICVTGSQPTLARPTKQRQKRESSGEAASQTQRGGLKRDRQISQEIRNAHNRMNNYHYQYNR